MKMLFLVVHNGKHLALKMGAAHMNLPAVFEPYIWEASLQANYHISMDILNP
jgi:hypothetical protein